MERKTVIVLYGKNQLDIDETQKNKGILQELSSVSYALSKLGYKVVNLEILDDLTFLISKIIKLNPYLVFNLLKCSNNQYGYIQLLLTMLRNEGITVTGANENVIFSSSNIFYFKKIMYLSNINTPKWQQLKDIQTQGIDIEFPFIVKPIYKGKSKEVPEQLLLHSESEFYELYNKLNLSFHKKYFIEPYIKGQDLNIYLLGSDSDPEIFANYEGLLSDFNKNDVSDGIDQESFNSFLFDTTSVNTQNDTSVGNRKYAYTFKEIALTCWNNYLFSGYGEIHFRIDCFNKPWIVGITINPSLSLNSPFVKSAVKRGYSYEGIIIKIIDESIFY